MAVQGAPPRRQMPRRPRWGPRWRVACPSREWALLYREHRFHLQILTGSWGDIAGLFLLSQVQNSPCGFKLKLDLCGAQDSRPGSRMHRGLGTFTQVPRWGVIRAAVHPETTQPQATERTEFGRNRKVVRNERFRNGRDLDVGAREPGVRVCRLSRGGTGKFPCSFAVRLPGPCAILRHLLFFVSEAARAQAQLRQAGGSAVATADCPRPRFRSPSGRHRG